MHLTKHNPRTICRLQGCASDGSPHLQEISQQRAASAVSIGKVTSRSVASTKQLNPQGRPPSGLGEVQESQLKLRTQRREPDVLDRPVPTRTPIAIATAKHVRDALGQDLVVLVHLSLHSLRAWQGRAEQTLLSPLFPTAKWRPLSRPGCPRCYAVKRRPSRSWGQWLGHKDDLPDR
jgi:hypothetical protein